MAFCPTCKRPFDDQADFCPFDGTALSPGDIGLGGPTADHAPEQPIVETASQVVAVSAMESSVDALELTARKRSQVYRGLIGKTLDGRYRIESVLGEGGMGIVFLAKHVVIEKTVAVKVLKKDAAKNESVAKRFVREAQAASRIAHPNIIDVTDFGTTKSGIIYSVMEYVEGSTLAKVLRYESPLPVERVIRIAAQMARALEAAHGKGVVHRDLKPENVFLVDRDGRRDFVKIVDFGIARVLPIPGNSEVSRLTRVGTVFGTPEYMAPEQAAGRSDTDHRVDIYALGTIMYEMLSGDVPHRGDSTVRTLAMQMLDPIKPLSQLPTSAHIDREVEAIVMKALEKKRDDRFGAMDDMLRALLAVTDDAETIRGSTAVALSAASTTLHDAGVTEMEANPAGAAFTNEPVTVEHPGRGLTAAPTELYQVLTPKGEPAFVRRSRRPSIDDLDEEPIQPIETTGKGWIAALAVAVAVAAGVAIFFLLAGDNESATGSDTDQLDGAMVASDDPDVDDEDDAGASGVVVSATETRDAGPTRVASNGGIRTGPNGRRRPDGGLTSLGPDVELEVITHPKGGTLWFGDDYAGPSGTSIRRPHGTQLKLRCSKTGYKSGMVTLSFEGDGDLAVCRLKKKAHCVKDLKNPFAKCP